MSVVVGTLSIATPFSECHLTYVLRLLTGWWVDSCWSISPKLCSMGTRDRMLRRCGDAALWIHWRIQGSYHRLLVITNHAEHDSRRKQVYFTNT
jgi:hypothetical protein